MTTNPTRRTRQDRPARADERREASRLRLRLRLRMRGLAGPGLAAPLDFEVAPGQVLRPDTYL